MIKRYGFPGEDPLTGILPHRGAALLISRVSCDLEDRTATGCLDIGIDNPWTVGHFGIMPGVLIAEFVHLTGLVLASSLTQTEDDGSIVVLRSSSIQIDGVVVPPKNIFCHVRIERVHENGRTMLFAADVSFDEAPCKNFAYVEFTGERLPKRVFERLTRPKGI